MRVEALILAREGRTAGLAPRSAPSLPLALGAAFAVLFAFLAWDPHDRGDWLLENLISFPLAVALVLYRRRLPLSATSWWLVFGFLALHEIGSHYTYSLVPWMEWSQTLFGWAPDWDRNHYDRIVHLAFGLMLTRPVAEVLRRPLYESALLRSVVPVAMIAMSSMIYELLEWAAAAVVDPALGIAFVGAQGDIWDAQKDMALALGGSVLVVVWIRGSAAVRSQRRCRPGTRNAEQMRP